MKKTILNFKSFQKIIQLKLFGVAMKSLILIILSLLIFEVCAASKILVVYPTASRSQVVVTQLLSKELAKRGHKITTVSLFPLEKPVPNYRDIKIQMDDQKYHKGHLKVLQFYQSTYRISNSRHHWRSSFRYKQAIFNIISFSQVTEFLFGSWKCDDQ